MCIVYDLDGTICSIKEPGQTYADVKPNYEIIKQLNMFYDLGIYIIINTARHMKTCNGDVNAIELHVGKLTTDWLSKYGVKYNELRFGKPYAMAYVDDKAVQPDVNSILKLVEPQYKNLTGNNIQ